METATKGDQVYEQVGNTVPGHRPLGHWDSQVVLPRLADVPKNSL